jgi:hypothetical protein
MHDLVDNQWCGPGPPWRALVMRWTSRRLDLLRYGIWRRKAVAMGRLDGTISLSGLPSHRGLILDLCLFHVSGPDAPAPHGGDPPAEAATDCHKVVEQVDLNAESQRVDFDQPFSLERQPGFYYVQVRAVLFRSRDGSLFAQAEQFFFGHRPVRIGPVSEGRITLPVSWPTEPLEDLHRYGTVGPQPARPWWRFW